MKKILKYYLPLFMTVIALGFFIVFSLIRNNENALKCVFNKNCKIISSTKKATVEIDDVVSADSKVFEDEGNFYLVSDSYRKEHFGLMTINKNKNNVTFPMSYYDVLFSTYLILPEGSDGIFLSDKIKGSGFDSQLKINNSKINFEIPEHRIEIIFKGE